MCHLHVQRKSSSFAEYLKTTRLPVDQSFEDGDYLFGRRYEGYGFSCVVSDRDMADFPGQIQDAIAFLRKYEKALSSLIESQQVDDIGLDFRYTCRLSENNPAQFDFLPHELIRRAGSLGMAIELSHYRAHNY